MTTPTHRRSAGRCRAMPALFAIAAVLLAACRDADRVRVTLQSVSPPGFDVRRVEVRGQVTGPVAGLRYKWFSVAGTMDPQESARPVAVFTYADGSVRDRVTLEVWRGDVRVARNEINLALDETRARLAALAVPKVSVTITTIPKATTGGPDTRTDIAGEVTGALLPSHDVVVYARANDVWYIQPKEAARHAIDANGHWSTWTHEGTDYAALVVRPAFDPLPRYDILPQVGGYVVARVSVEGRR